MTKQAKIHWMNFKQGKVVIENRKKDEVTVLNRASKDESVPEPNYLPQSQAATAAKQSSFSTSNSKRRSGHGY